MLGAGGHKKFLFLFLLWFVAMDSSADIEISRHRQWHKKDYQCTMCSKTFTTLKIFHDHIRRHYALITKVSNRVIIPQTPSVVLPPVLLELRIPAHYPLRITVSRTRSVLRPYNVSTALRPSVQWGHNSSTWASTQVWAMNSFTKRNWGSGRFLIYLFEYVGPTYLKRDTKIETWALVLRRGSKANF